MILLYLFSIFTEFLNVVLLTFISKNNPSYYDEVEIELFVLYWLIVILKVMAFITIL